MVWVTLSTFLFITTLCGAQKSSNNVDIDSLDEHVKKMDGILQDVQSHAQAQEQKYSAVLSSVLSQLKQTTDELSLSKNVTEDLQEEIKSLKTEMENLKDIDNNMVDAKCQCRQASIGFDAYVGVTKATRVMPSGRIVFDVITHNEGKGYNKTTGYFTVPVSGTYLFWTNIIYRSDKSAIMFYIKTSGKTIGVAFGMANEYYGTASATASFYLKKGDRTWISPSVEVEPLGLHSSAAAVLITPY